MPRTFPTKQQVEFLETGSVQKTGDTMTGALSVNAPRNFDVVVKNVYQVTLKADNTAYNGNTLIGTWTIDNILSMFGPGEFHITVTDANEDEVLYFEAVGTSGLNPGTYSAENVRYRGESRSDTTVTVTPIGNAFSANGKINSSYGYKISDYDVYPLFTRNSWSTSNDESYLPFTPCFVLSLSDNALYWCDGTPSS